ncbi:DUF4350 domain-containing protein [Microbispora sp. NPDC049125]|uniref:DUF4350 domain-containing protein n=1 Tax=Microbispora sp. NPDC049125 TaxID=3154929 RepID=UPI0034666A83
MSLQAAGRQAPAPPRAPGLWRRLRGILVVGLLVLAAALVPALMAPRTEGRFADPADASLDGALALARLLDAHGVKVARVDDADDALAVADAGSQLLVTDASMLSRDEATRLAASGADRLILGTSYLDVLAAKVTVKRQGTRVRSREPGCGLREAVHAGSARMGGVSFTAPPGSTGCYQADGLPTLVRYADGARTVTVVGDAAFLTNRRLAEDGDAALAVNLAGAKRTLVWIVPPALSDIDAGGHGGSSFGDLIPSGVPWAVFQLAVAVAVLALWRGRRLGPVVAERLPVVVRAAETVEGRGRLYRSRRARDLASWALRAAAADRLTPRLGLPRTASPDEIVAAVAVRTGQEMEHVRSALYGPAPSGDAGLVALADYLDSLERQVRDS